MRALIRNRTSAMGCGGHGLMRRLWLGGIVSLPKKARSVRSGLSSTRRMLLAWADRLLVVLEAQPLVHRRRCRRAEVAQENQILQVIGEAAHGVRMVIQHQRIAHFQLAVVLAADRVRAEERVIHPF